MTEPTITRRRICWPNPDATCLEGGCMYCNDNKPRSISTIRRYAEEARDVPNRGKGSQMATAALEMGLRNHFYGRVDYKLSDGTWIEVP